MIGKRYPFNKMQEELIRRQVLRLKVVLYICLCLFISMGVDIALADAPSGANPGGAPGYPFNAPDEAFEESGIFGPGCSSNYDNSACPYIRWWNCGGATCVAVQPSAFGFARVELGANDKLRMTGGGAVARYSAGVWSVVGYTSTDAELSAGCNNVGVTYDMYTPDVGSYQSNYGTGQGCRTLPPDTMTLYTAGNFVWVPPPTPPGSTMSMDGPIAGAVGESIRFRATWGNLPFSPYFVYFSTTTGSSAKLIPYSYNFPLNSSGSYNISYTFNQPGVYQATAYVGNRNCTTTADGFPSGSGCEYAYASKGIIIIKNVPEAVTGGVWGNGGAIPANFIIDGATATGAFLQSDKGFYTTQDVVYLRYAYRTNEFVPASMAFFPNGTGSALTYSTTEINEFDEGEYNYFSHQYTAPGRYQPVIQIRSSSYNPSSPSTFLNIFLGGGEVANPYYSIYVRQPQTVYGPMGSGDSLLGIDFTSTGSTSLDVTPSFDGGIFGLDVFQNFQGFGETGNEMIDALNGPLKLVIDAIKYIGELLNQVLSFSAFYSDITFPFNQEQGAVLTVPTTMAHRSMTSLSTSPTFTVQYSTRPSSNLITVILQTIVPLGIFAFILDKLGHFISHQ